MNLFLPMLAEGDSWLGFVFGLLLMFAVGAASAYGFLRSRAQSMFRAKQLEADGLIRDAQHRADETVRKAEVEAQKKLLETMERFEQETADTRKELREAEHKLSKRQDNLDKKLDVLETKENKIEQAEQRIAQREQAVATQETELDELLAQERDELLRISKLTQDEARSMALERIEQEVEREAGQLVEKSLMRAEESARENARKLTIDAIQRFAAEHTCEATTATIDVPTDDIKGRIIGREGRNIRTFEKITGVSVIVDDTPGVVSVSCFDPVRKEVARLALERLIKDGRIHPTRIEELIEKTTKEVDEKIMEAGNHAALETNVNGLHKKLIEALGRMQYRTSYGQNVLRHSVEVAFLSGIMAEELRLDAALARRCGLLHDIGKALPHDMEGTHTKLGAEYCKRYQEPAEVINAAEGHHGDVPATSVYTPLVTAADAISASRPGGRRESLERYIKRNEELESIATGFEGVNLAYAVEAGREVRVIVDSSMVDDRSSLKLARDIAKKVEETMTYPGEVKINVLREVRAIEYAR